ncbi:tRNA glutamyl-Q(34) synthetase GluQRS [Mailhella massiliensis]|uniref:Glutamyl-Q tRNA(Asp) synthetase n=1 Tax=Mailhella massiliensis TaxID=1903261 RepID=A0A921AUM6_9BACT|nr:tRNA glutamyl-Q(34) synthetase GluQRS [Mailhella massiliensis]HJD96414.1 tRNA glutamyl-Q(34) synthetase GluQRS [Mailhella massiliensis]
MKKPVGRFAPSPTGLLHLGNAWSFFLAWLAARAEGGRIILRHEDIDPARSRKEWMDAIERDLLWLGLDWDEGPDDGPHAPYRQSRSSGFYESALESLKARGFVYPCYCTRKELRTLAGAPHGAADGLGDAGAAYPGACRNLTEKERAQKEAEGRRPALRLLCPDGDTESFTDLVLGPQRLTLKECGGDFALRRSDGVWAYQLAVVVDDMRMEVTQVVRGEDILLSTPRQLLLYRFLGGTPPAFAHIPLLHDARGERLAKRHKSLSIAALREAGCSPEAVAGRLAHLAGLQERPGPVRPAALAERIGGPFPWHLLPKGRILVPDGAERIWK